MSKLQNNFTTIEQSQRLLELGVPAWTADFFYPTKKSEMPIIIVDIKVGWNLKYAIPCWSVGRLIEIYNECWCGDCCDEGIFIPQGHIVLQRVLIDFFDVAKNGQLDFTKLEE